jgi:hypothetical protein
VSFDLFLLPLLGGYLFLTRFAPTKFRAQILAKYQYRLLLESAVVGVCLLAAIRGCLMLFGGLAWVKSATDFWHRASPIPNSGTAAAAFVLGAALLGLNRIGKIGAAAYLAYRKYGDELFGLILRAQRGDQSGPFPILITLKNGKMYTGFVAATPTPMHERPYLKLIPSSSGHRRQDDLTLCITTLYKPVYERIKKGDFGLDALNYEDFAVVIPLDEILTATTYVEEVPFDAFQVAPATPASPTSL